ncbi:MAG TPA: gliding motility-associated C-terminal domain-containing protein [Chitinophagales bacterium]|nr:gliding motility-associated C-terminal domain-containing protein [Chitinophagales bacterium]
MQGSHVFVVGVANPTLAESSVQQITGMERYPDQQPNLYKSDYTLATAAQSESLLQSIGMLICHADLRLEKSVSDSVTCAGSNVVFTIIVSNDGSDVASGVQVHDYLPSGYTYVSDDGGAATSITGSTIKWIVGTLSNGETDTLRITAMVNTSGNYKNVAEIISSSKEDGDSTPNNDDGDQSEDDEDAAMVTLINCDDGNPCTADFCAINACSHAYIPSSCAIAGDNEICSGETTQFIASGGTAYSWSGPNGFSGNTAGTGAVSSAGVYSVTVTNASGCTNTCSVMLAVDAAPACNISGDNVICPDKSTSFTASGGITYLWSGPNGYTANGATVSSVNTPGNYSVTVTNAKGCSSDCTVALRQLSNTYTTINDSVCFGQNYVMAAVVYSNTGTYRDTFVSSNGCDSIVTLNLYIIPRLYGPFNYTICDGDSVVVGNSVYRNTGVYYDTFVSASGCDSIAISSVQVMNQSELFLDTAVCAGESITIGNSNYTVSGNYVDSLLTSYGCDSIVHLKLTVLPTRFTLVEPVICSGEIFSVGTSDYSSSGTYYDTLVSANGCDSVVQTDLTVLPVPVTIIDTAICFGEVFVSGASNYNSTGTYYDTLVATNGCDSIVVTNLSVLPLSYGPFHFTICDGDNVVINNSVYKNTGTYYDTFISALGCDSIVISSIRVLSHSQTAIDTIICSGEYVSVGWSVYDSSGIYFDTLTAGNGCDSVIQTNLLVLPHTNRIIDTAICSGEIFSVGNSVYSASGMYYDTLVSSNGCDSVVQTNLQVLPVAVTVIDAAICEGKAFLFGNKSYSASGNYSDTLPSATGCDSIVNLNLLVIPAVYGPFDFRICQGDSVVVGTSVYTISGTYYDTLVSASGCDSVVVSSITVLNHSHTLIDTVLCSGEFISVGWSGYDSTGIYFDTLTADNGCDSIIETHLQILPNSSSSVTAEICQGERFVVGSSSYFLSGTYYDTLTAINGCDSIVTTRLTVRPNRFTTVVVSICKGDSLMVGNSVYRSSGTYYDWFSTIHGCDSIVETKLTVLPVINGTQDRFICSGDVIQFHLTGGIQYQWTPSAFLSCSNCGNPQASPSNDINYIVRVTDINGCTGYDTIHVDVSRVEVAMSLSDDDVCEGQSVFFSASYSSDYPEANRLWNFGDGYLTANQSAVHAYFNDGAFNVTLTVTNSLGCIASAGSTVIVYPQPDIVATNDTGICMGDSLMLSAAGADSYAWLPAAYLNNPNIANPVAAPASTIQYNVIGISANGCLNYATVAVTVNPLPDLQVSPDVMICPNGSATLTASGGTRYEWSPAHDLSSTTSNTVIASPEVSTVYFVNAWNQFGCKAMDSVRVNLYPKTEMKVSPSGEICKGEQLDLNITGGEIYRWSPPTGLSCDVCENPVASPVNTTHYSIAATDTYGCVYHDSVSVFVREIPKVSAMPDVTICKGETVILFTDTSSADGVHWFPSAFLDDAGKLNPAAAPENSITYVVSASNSYGCKNADSVRVNVLNKVDADLLGDDVCEGESVRLEAMVNKASENGYYIQWLPAGLFEDSNAASQEITPHDDMEISVIVSSQTCEADTSSYSLQMHESPDVNAGFDRIVYTGETVSLSAFSYSMIDSYSWSPADKLDCSDCSSPNWVADGSQIFTVRVVDENGCSATDTVAFRVIGGCRDGVYVPNAFTPNGDEVNDKLLVRSLHPVELHHFKIFDRWGNQVYSSTDISEGWDGTLNGRKVADGVYVYHLKAGCSNGQTAFLKGNVTVIR